MSRINTNIASLQAIHTLGRNNEALSQSLQRLSTGLKINTGADAPAGLIASESLRSEIAGINQAVDNSQRAGNVVSTAEGALSEVSSLLLEAQSLTNEAANTGALSSDEIKANQLQLDSILNSINRIANTTQFNGVKLLNGALGYTTSGVLSTAIDTVQINAAKIPQGGDVTIAVQVVQSAQTAQVGFTQAGIGSAPTSIEISGNDGVEQLSFAASAHNSAIAFAINNLKDSTGVSATVSGSALKLSSTSFGSHQFVSVKTLAGSFVDSKTYGQDAGVNINGTKADVDGLDASVRTGDLDLQVTLDSAFASIKGSSTSFVITGGGATFQLGSEVKRAGQISIGVDSVSTSTLGNNLVGHLSDLASGGTASLVSGNTISAQKILDQAIRQVATQRGRLGALQKDVLNTNVNSLQVALENVTSAESNIRDADFATETANLTRAQILVQANTSVLAQANSTPQQVLTLLGR